MLDAPGLSPIAPICRFRMGWVGLTCSRDDEASEFDETHTFEEVVHTISRLQLLASGKQHYVGVRKAVLGI